MGTTPDGTFSPLRFATAYGKMTLEGKAAIFGRGGLAGDMDAFNQIASDQQAASKFYNHSNSGHAGGIIGGMALLGEGFREGGIHGALGAAALLAALGTMGNGAARLLASPGFARTMLKARAARPGAVDQMFQSFAYSHPSLAPYVNAYRARLAPTAIAGAVGTLSGKAGPVPASQVQ